MPETLENRLQQVRGRVRQVLWMYGLSWLVAVLFASTLLVGMLDWMFHLDDPGVRLILGLGIVAAGSWVGWRHLISPLLVTLSDVDLAMRIEQRFPGFNDSLASSVEFMQHDVDPRSGSPELQRRVIEKTLRDIERINISDIIDHRDVLRIAATAVCVCVVTAGIIGLNQAEAATALNRLVFPFSANPWPKQTELRFVNSDFEPLANDPEDPLRIARGDTLDIFVENIKGPLPRTVSMEYRFADDQVISEPLRKTSLRDEQGQTRDVCAATLVIVKGPMLFRARGGDHQDMQWHTVDVVPPPLIEQLDVTVTPPPYTGRNSVQLPQGVGHVRGLIGTKVDIRAIVNKPLQSGTLRVKGTGPTPVRYGDDRRHFTASFTISEAGVHSYWFALKDRQGFENTEAPRYEVRGIADSAPDIYIDKPANDVRLTADAELPLRVVAKDDLGVKDVRLHYKLSDAGGDSEASLVLQAADERPEQLVVDHVWQMSELSLKPGMQIIFHAEATDDFDLSTEHLGRSISRSIRIVTAEEKTDELAARQAMILEELDRVHNTQSQAHDQIRELQLQLDKVGQLRPVDIDTLKRVELEQRQISSRLVNPIDGVESRALDVLSEMENNKLDDPETTSRMNLIADEVAVLREGVLPLIEQELTKARKTSQSDSDKSNGSKALLDEFSRTEQHQTAVIESLNEMRKQLARWRNHRDLTTEVQDLLNNQESINQDTTDIGKRTIPKDFGDLTPQEQADLIKLRDRQQQQAERLEKFRSHLDDMAKQLGREDSGAADSLLDAADHLDGRATSGQMREAAQLLAKNNVTQAANSQQQIISDLNDLDNALRNRTDADVETLIKKMKQAEDELETLKQRQAEMLRKIRQASEQPDQQEREAELEKLVKEQRSLHKQVKNMARRLRRLQLNDARKSAKRASSRMQQAEDALQKGDGQQAGDQVQEALDDIEQAQRELAQARRDAEEQLAHEELEKIGDQLKGLIERQQAVIDETLRLDQKRTELGKWNRPLLKSLANLGEVQLGLKTDTEALTDGLKAAEVIALALRGASRSMDKAAARLKMKKTDAKTVAVETAAKQRFLDLAEALKPGKSGTGQPGSTAGGGDGQPGGQEGIPQLAQLKLLKTLQLDLNERTIEFDEIRDRNGKLTDDQQQELADAAREQGVLADLMRNLTRAITEAFQPEESDEAKPKPPDVPE